MLLPGERRGDLNSSCLRGEDGHLGRRRNKRHDPTLLSGLVVYQGQERRSIKDQIHAREDDAEHEKHPNAIFLILLSS